MSLLKYAHSLRELSFGAVGVGYVLRKGAHKPETVKALEHILDGVIEIRSVEGKYRSKSALEIQKLREMQYSTKQYWHQVNAKDVAMKPRI